jgi:hypothetical protein
MLVPDDALLSRTVRETRVWGKVKPPVFTHVPTASLFVGRAFIRPRRRIAANIAKLPELLRSRRLRTAHKKRPRRNARA